MAIIKVLKREKPYVQIDKIGIDDPNLSWEATGLLTYLVGRPNNWKVNVMHLSSVKKNKETSTRKALLELRKYNYCHLFEIRKGGKYIEKFYLVFEVPTQYDEIKSNMDIELKEGEKIFYVKVKKEINSNNSPEVENQLMVENIENKEILPNVEKPKMVKPKVENQALINKELNNNKMNKEKNHAYDFNKKDDDLKKIEELFKEFGIDFSIKHKIKIKELLQKNSIDFLMEHFKKQYEILKKKENVKSIASVMSKHLFQGTCELDTSFLLKKEHESQLRLQEDEKKMKQLNNSIQVFLALPLEKQEEIENEILKIKKEINPQIKKISPIVFHKMIASDIRKILIRESLL